MMVYNYNAIAGARVGGLSTLRQIRPPPLTEKANLMKGSQKVHRLLQTMPHTHLRHNQQTSRFSLCPYFITFCCCIHLYVYFRKKSLMVSFSFYRAKLCIRGTSHGPVSVSATSQSSTKTAKRKITQTAPHDSSGTLVFWCQRSPRNSTGVTPYKGAECRWGGSKSATFDE